MGPLFKIVNFIFGETAGSVGKKVAAHAQSNKDVLLDGTIFKWTHKDKIAELAGDSGLSFSYVSELAEKSTSKGDIAAVLDYLGSSRAINLDNETRLQLIRGLKHKLEVLQDQEALREIINAYRAKGLSMVEHAMDYLA